MEDNVLIQDCLSATYDDRKYIDKKDMAIIKKLGLNFRGKNAYPLFRRYKPNYYPWYLTGDECRFLTIALEQAAYACIEVKDDESFLPDVFDTGYCLVRYFEDDKWKDKQSRIDTGEEKRKITIQTNELKLACIKKKSVKSEGKWEIGFFVNSTMPIKEKERPYFPIVMLMVDSISGHVFNAYLSEPSDYYQNIFDNFVEFIEKTGVIPQEIFVEKDDLQTILYPATAALGIKLTKVKKCRMFKEAQRGLLGFGRRLMR